LVARPKPNTKSKNAMPRNRPKTDPPQPEPIIYEMAFDAELYAQLEDYARMYRMDIEDVIKEAVDQYLQENS
jgi:hypothetical protein